MDCGNGRKFNAGINREKGQGTAGLESVIGGVV